MVIISPKSIHMHMNEAKAEREMHFPSTHWSAIRLAGETETERGQRALGELLLRYQAALKAYLFEKFRCSKDQAEDLLHDFIYEAVLQRGLITKARQGNTRFRSYLLTALHNFAVSNNRQQHARKRAPAQPLESLENLPEGVELPDHAEMASTAFDVAWARAVMAEALQRMERECHQCGRKLVWIIFQARLAGPILQGMEPVPYETLAASCALASVAQARHVLLTSKRIFQRHLRAVVGQYAGNSEAIDQELTTLQEILSNIG